jgi:hypothetical protein
MGDTTANAVSQAGQIADRNIDARIWGPHGWSFIKAVCQGFDPAKQNAEDLVQWINLLPKVLPCESCRANFEHTLQKYPFKPYCHDDCCLKWFQAVRADVALHEKKYPAKFPWRYLGYGALFAAGVGVGYVLAKQVVS